MRANCIHRRRFTGLFTTLRGHVHSAVRRARLPVAVALAALAMFPQPASGHMDLLYPDVPLVLRPGETLEIRWDVYIDHGPGSIRVFLSTDDGRTFEPISASTPYSGPDDHLGSFVWTVPDRESFACRIRAVYTTDDGGTYYNGLTSDSENNPRLAITADDEIVLVLEQGLGDYQGTRDTTLYEENTNANGGGAHFFAGNTKQSQARRALIGFDLSQLAEGSLILSAELGLTVSRTITGPTTQSLHRLTRDWGEGTRDAGGEEGKGVPPAQGNATWQSNFHSDSAWTRAGAEGDYVSGPSAAAAAGTNAARVTWGGAGLARDVQDWLEGRANNFGWILIGDESAATTAKRFFSSENTAVAAGQRPRLTVRYVGPVFEEPTQAVNWAFYK